ncbi:hypothetical protein WS91_22640 [Burkholderia sp. MSMB1498]|nr:hypothetical protein WS91_22640 [Burkholderia sp. MSMB1498]
MAGFVRRIAPKPCRIAPKPRLAARNRGMLEGGGSRQCCRGWRLAAGGWRPAAGGRRMAVGEWRRAARGVLRAVRCTARGLRCAMRRRIVGPMPSGASVAASIAGSSPAVRRRIARRARADRAMQRSSRALRMPGAGPLAPQARHSADHYQFW